MAALGCKGGYPLEALHPDFVDVGVAETVATLEVRQDFLRLGSGQGEHTLDAPPVGFFVGGEEPRDHSTGIRLDPVRQSTDMDGRLCHEVTDRRIYPIQRPMRGVCCGACLNGESPPRPGS